MYKTGGLPGKVPNLKKITGILTYFVTFFYFLLL